MVAIVSSPVQDIRVADIHASPLNPRKHFDEKKLAELAGNLRDVGQIEAITVRPSASQPGKFELVNGERRWRAAQMAGLDTLAAKVREMTDAEALAIMLITGAEGNVEALTPLEEAEGYQNAMRIMALALEGVAARFGKSVTYVHERLALLQLPDEARAALEKRELAPSTAFQIARIPGDEKRSEAARAILHSDVHGGVMPVRAAKLYIEKQICRTLQGAPFDTADADLVPSAGACATCPWRAGNNRETYGDVKNPHTCMNPGCFEQKVTAARARVLAREAKDGKEALPEAVNAEVFPAGEKGVSWKSAYVAFTQPVPRDMLKPEVTKAPTWVSLCGDAGVKVYVGVDQDGRAVDVARIGEVLAAVPADEAAIFSDDVARRHGLARPSRGGGAAPDRSFAEQEKIEQDLREKAERAAKKRTKKARGWLDELVTGLEGMAAAGKPAWVTYAFWSLMFERMLAALGDEDVAFVCELYGIDAEIDGDRSAREVLTDFVGRCSKERCGALVTAMTLAPWLRAEGPDAKFVTEWHEAFVAEKSELASTEENAERSTPNAERSSDEAAPVKTATPAAFAFDRNGECTNPERVEIPCAKGYQCALLVAEMPEGAGWTYGAIRGGRDESDYLKYEPRLIANGEETRDEALEAAAMIACNGEDEGPFADAIEKWRAEESRKFQAAVNAEIKAVRPAVPPKGKERLELVRKLVESGENAVGVACKAGLRMPDAARALAKLGFDGPGPWSATSQPAMTEWHLKIAAAFEAARIKTAATQNRMIKTATSGRAKALIELATEEDCQCVLRMLGAKAPKPAKEEDAA